MTPSHVSWRGGGGSEEVVGVCVGGRGAEIMLSHWGWGCGGGEGGGGLR